MAVLVPVILAQGQAVPEYLNFADGEKNLAALASQNAGWIQLDTIGTSAGGR